MIVATAGHVDHGKTSLVKNLTGVDTDSLEEEKRRGLSINLGYAYRKLDATHSIGFIDVPGHHRFINTMIAGISGIDVGMMVVAADDGLMPQTHEHVNVLQLLGVKQYVLVISKVDRVDARQRDLVRQQAASLLPPDTAVFEISNIDGSGIDELREALDALALSHESRHAAGLFRMSIDRAFNVKGSGLVVTGTVASGHVEIGEYLQLQPQQASVRVRGIHAQDQEVTQGVAGQRCALNITGPIEKNDIERGDWLTATDAIRATEQFDARIKLLATSAAAIKHHSFVKLHLGAKRVRAKIMILAAATGKTRLEAGQHALVRFRLDTELVCLWGDRFLVRDDSETFTLGGGIVIDPQPPISKKFRAQNIALLEAMELSDLNQVFQKVAVDQDDLLDLQRLRKQRNFSESETVNTYEAAISSEMKRVSNKEMDYLLANNRWACLSEQLQKSLGQWHSENPGEPGIKPALLQQQLELGKWQPILPILLADLLRGGTLAFAGGLLKLAQHTPQRSETESKEWTSVENILLSHGLRLPAWSLMLEQSKMSEAVLKGIVSTAVRDQRLFSLSNGRYLLPAVLSQLASAVVELNESQQGFSVKNLRDKVGCGRNVAIDMLEFLDEQRITVRQDQIRKVLDEPGLAALVLE